MAAGCVRQVVVLCSIDCTGIGLGGLIMVSHYGYCISCLYDKGSRLNNLVGLVSLKAVIYYTYYSCTGLCEKLLHICIFFIISFIIIV